MSTPKVFPGPATEALGRVEGDLSIWRDRVSKWCAINTGSRNLAGLAAFLPELQAAFSVLPGTMTCIQLEPEAGIDNEGRAFDRAAGQCMLLTVRPDANIRLVLTGHYDTVFPADTAFREVREASDGVLNGPGVADMKGGILVMLEALQALESSPYASALGYDVLLSPDEEIGSPGSAPYLAELGRRAALGLTFEPAMPDGYFASARKGSGNFSLVVHGRSAHVGRAHADGRSAILAAAEFTMALEALNGCVDGVTFNVGRIDGGGPNNAVPEGAVVRFNARAPDHEGQNWAAEQIDALVANANRRDGIHCHLHGGFTRPPKPITPSQKRIFDDLSAIGTMLGIPIGFRATGGVCEGNNLAASGCPNIDTLGPVGGALHSSDEFAVLASFPERARLVAGLLLAYASGELDPMAARRAGMSAA